MDIYYSWESVFHARGLLTRISASLDPQHPHLQHAEYNAGFIQFLVQILSGIMTASTVKLNIKYNHSC
jgi:hypothetical protein